MLLPGYDIIEKKTPSFLGPEYLNGIGHFRRHELISEPHNLWISIGRKALEICFFPRVSLGKSHLSLLSALSDPCHSQGQRGLSLRGVLGGEP